MQASRIRTLVAESDGFSSRTATLLRGFGDLTLANLNRSELLTAVSDIDVLWVRLRHRIDAEVMAAAPRLKMIVTATTGLNHIDLEEVARRGIQLISLRGEEDFLQDVRATAEHTLTSILALLRHVPAAVAHVQNGGWDRDQFKGHELYGKTAGIVGYGRLGRIVARYIRAFDVNVLAADPKVTPASIESNVSLVSFTQLLHQADLVTLHVQLCDKTVGFFGREQFAAMKPGAWFINTSRGELVNESALLNALRSGKLAGAALDVLCDERGDNMKNHPLVAYSREHSNLMITPHIGGCTVESMEKTEYFLGCKLTEFFETCR